MTQIEAAELARKSRAMVGNATLTIVLSRTDIVMPSAIATIAQYRRGSGNPSAWAALAAAALGAAIALIIKARRRGGLPSRQQLRQRRRRPARNRGRRPPQR